MTEETPQPDTLDWDSRELNPIKINWETSSFKLGLYCAKKCKAPQQISYLPSVFQMVLAWVVVAVGLITRSSELTTGGLLCVAIWCAAFVLGVFARQTVCARVGCDRFQRNPMKGYKIGAYKANGNETVGDPDGP